MNPRLLLLLWSYRREILGALAFLLALLMAVAVAITGAFVSGVPLVPNHLVPIYQDEAANLTAPDGTKLEGLDWHWLMVLDAVRFQQDFDRVDAGSIHDLAERFIKTVHHEGGGPCVKGEPHCVCQSTEGPWQPLGVLAPAGDSESLEETPLPEVCTIEAHVTYELHSLQEVMVALGLEGEQVDQVTAMLPADVTQPPGSGGEPVPCAEFVPNPEATYTWPVAGTLTSCFGPRPDPWTGDVVMHYGVDIATSSGEPVKAASGGTITLACDNCGVYGKLVVLVSPEGLETWYGHLAGMNVSHGQEVGQGEVVGYVGSTGKSTGPHLHFETRPGGNPVDPLGLYE